MNFSYRPKLCRWTFFTELLSSDLCLVQTISSNRVWSAVRRAGSYLYIYIILYVGQRCCRSNSTRRRATATYKSNIEKSIILLNIDYNIVFILQYHQGNKILYSFWNDVLCIPTIHKEANVNSKIFFLVFSNNIFLPSIPKYNKI